MPAMENMQNMEISLSINRTGEFHNHMDFPIEVFKKKKTAQKPRKHT